MTDFSESGRSFLAHYGVMGMKWGVRKDGRNSPNENYSANQRARDRQVYGRGGEKRVNRALNRGESISVARGSEKTRRDTVMNRNKYARQTGKIVGVVGGVVAGNFAISGLRKLTQSRVGSRFIRRTFGAGAAVGISSAARALDTPYGRIAVSSGAAYMGNLLAGDIGVSINMRTAGYNPNRR